MTPRGNVGPCHLGQVYTQEDVDAAIAEHKCGIAKFYKNMAEFRRKDWDPAGRQVFVANVFSQISFQILRERDGGPYGFVFCHLEVSHILVHDLYLILKISKSIG